TGVGIPAKDLPYIFEEFRQVDRDGAEAQGSGLGLAIVKKTVELLGGTIKAESSVGEGTRFTLIIGNYKQ
ncbi:MAG: two-component system sensor histidine kinase BaeS, partial [Candidatus Latescibacterota bacterium]